MIDEQAYIDYINQRQEDYQYRDNFTCLSCYHLGSEHDKDEIGECQACGCVAFHTPF